MEMISLEIIPIPRDIIEKEFPEWISRKGFGCLKICNDNLSPINSKLYFDFQCDFNLILGKGIPDFFIWNQTEYFLCGFKTLGDSLHKEQISFIFSNYLKWNFALAQCYIPKQ